MRIYVHRYSLTAPLDVDGQTLGSQVLEMACTAFGVSADSDRMSLWKVDSPDEIALTATLEEAGVEEGAEIGLVFDALRVFSVPFPPEE